jgi:hypothetical protein
MSIFLRRQSLWMNKNCCVCHSKDFTGCYVVFGSLERICDSEATNTESATNLRPRLSGDLPWVPFNICGLRVQIFVDARGKWRDACFNIKRSDAPFHQENSQPEDSATWNWRDATVSVVFDFYCCSVTLQKGFWESSKRERMLQIPWNLRIQTR